MDTLTDIDSHVAEILLEHIVFPACENENHSVNIPETNEPSVAYQNDNALKESDVETCNKMLDINKSILSSLLDLKGHITYSLEKCEEKLAAIESNLQTHAIGDTKVLICNAGIPYFKDRNYFFPSKNEDDVLKEKRKELQVRNLLRVPVWTRKERDIFLKAIKDEAITNVLCSQKIEHSKGDNAASKLNSRKANDGKIEQKRSPVNDLQLMNSLQKMEFDWFKISSTHFENNHSPLDCQVMWNAFLHPNINKNCWTKTEDVKLKQIAEKYKFQDWDNIAKELNTKRSAYQCFVRYNTTKKLPKVKHCNWKNKEDKRLLKLIDIFRIGDFIPWGEIASWIQNRTKQQVYFRWTYSLAPYLTKGRFTKTEDNILKDAVVKYGRNFRKISAALMPNRSTVQLHDRYQTLINNQTENWNLWTLSEDAKLLNLFGNLGPNWSAIAKQFSCKTRTQLRHRYTALQKYIKRGISLYEVHGNPLYNNKSVKEQMQMEELCWDAFNSWNNVTQNNYNTDVDKKLLEYFRTRCKKETFIKKQKDSSPIRNAKDEQNRVASLYNILQKLNTKLCIPDDLSNVNVENIDMHLLYLLREYIRKKNDKEGYLKFIEECRLRIFNKNTTTEGNSHFVPPPPFQSQVKQRKPKEHLNINYNLNTKNKFLLEQPIDFDTPNLVISYIGGNERELEFQKLSRLFHFVNSTTKPSLNVKGLHALPNKVLRQKELMLQHSDNKNHQKDSSSKMFKNIHTNATSVEIENNDTYNWDNALLNKHKEVSFGSVAEVTQEYNTNVIDADYATLLCLKNLMHLKRLNEECSSKPDHRLIHLDTSQEALNLLSARFEQLFKYPIGLSNITLPELHTIDEFSSEDITNKRKISVEPEDLKKPKMKKLRTLRDDTKSMR